MAATASQVFTNTPLAGIDLDAKSSTPAFRALTVTHAQDARKHVYVQARAALGSTATIAIGAAGSATADGGSAGFTVDTTGGVTNLQWFWARQTAL